MNVLHSTRFKWEIAAVLITIALGSLFHFVYDWSGNASGTAWFASVDESVNEHLKLLYWPSFLLTIGMVIWQTWRGGMIGQDFWFSRFIGLVVALVFIPIIYYTYTQGDANNAILAVDILTFIIAAFLISLVSWFLRDKPDPNRYGRYLTPLGMAGYLISGGLFVIFSYYPPSSSFIWST